jgi:hypothetical protein
MIETPSRGKGPFLDGNEMDGVEFVVANRASLCFLVLHIKTNFLLCKIRGQPDITGVGAHSSMSVFFRQLGTAATVAGK